MRPINPQSGTLNTRKISLDETGSATVLSLFMFVIMAMVGAAALDYSNLIASRTQLQVAADLAAHGALYSRETNDEMTAKAEAIELASFGMPHSRFGDILNVGDISFGTWDYDTQIFTKTHHSRQAVMVTTSRLASKLNSVESYLFKLVGIDRFDVVTSAVYTTYRPACFREGFVADGIVDIQSNNNYLNGFCIHSNTYVSVNQNNTYEAGTIVSMPDMTQIDLPASGFDKNAGLEEALRSAVYRLRIINRIDDLIAGLVSADPLYTPDYITSNLVVPLAGKKFDETDFVPGRIYQLNCSGSGKATITGNSPIREIVLVSNCEIKFGQGTVLEDVVMATTNTSAKSFNAPSSLQVGRDDGCAEGGGAQLITKGGMNFASDLRIFGGQLLAEGDIQFSANANGVEGASLITGGTISGTSNMNMGFCNGAGMEDNFEANYFRLAG
ncbi:MAG: TadE/TadG family type IV pilus assembly protein [Halocynthiibacter sp.]